MWAHYLQFQTLPVLSTQSSHNTHQEEVGEEQIYDDYYELAEVGQQR